MARSFTPHTDTASEQSEILGHPHRRAVLMSGICAAAGFALSPLYLFAAETPDIVNDNTGLNPIAVARVAVPESAAEISELLQAWEGTVSTGGARYSMGGQIASDDSLHFDMRALNKLVFLDVARKVVRVQSGMTWRALQSLIDPENLSVRIMQSYANFTIGGSVSVNVHGRYVGSGPIVNSVRALQLVGPDGALVEASRTERPDLFAAAIGGYGAFGIITEVELVLEDNEKLQRRVDEVVLDDYPQYFVDNILSDPHAVLHNAHLELPDLERATAVTWRHTDGSLTIEERLVPQGQDYSWDAWKIWALAEMPGGQFLRRTIFDPMTYDDPMVVWRNRETSLDVASLGVFSRENFTHALQEYFVPVAHCAAFARAIASILRDVDADILNVSIRYSFQDTTSLMPWAREEVFSFVLYYKQEADAEAQAAVGAWTTALIDAALGFGGSYYLPYQLHATEEQFAAAYPSHAAFEEAKRAWDPANRFRNRLWDKYLLQSG